MKIFRLKIETYYKAICLAFIALVVARHYGFLRYILRLEVIKRISVVGLLHNLVLVPVAAVIFIACFYGLGRRFLKLLCRGNIDNYYSNILSLALGLGLFNFIIYVFAVLRVIYPVSILLLLAFGIMIEAADIKEFIISLLSKWGRLSAWNPALLLITTVGLCYSLVPALSPSTSWDALAYHLPIPQFYAQNHGMILMPWMIMKQCTIGMEMVSSAAMSLGMETLPQLLSYFTEILAMCALFLFVNRNHSEGAARLSAALFAIMPVCMDIGGVTNNDFAVCLFTILAVTCFFEYAAEKRNEWLYLLSAFCGFALSAKMSGAITAAWLIISLTYIFARAKIRIPARTALTVLMILLVFGSFSYLRNYEWTGDPVFPYMENLFKRGDTDALAVIKKYSLEAKMTEGVKTSFLNYIKLPYYIVTEQNKYQHQPHFLVISAILVFLLRILFARKRFSPQELCLILFILFFSAIWFFGGTQLWRFALVVIPFMIFLTVKWCLDHDLKAVKIIALAVLSINLAPLLNWNVNNQLYGMLALPSLEKRNEPAKEHYLGKSLEYYDVYRYINANLPDNAKILLFREIRGYYLKRPYVWGDPLNQSVIVYSKYSNSGELLSRLKELGITHVVVNENRYFESPYYYDSHVMSLMHDLLAKYGRNVHESNGVELYLLNFDKAQYGNNNG